MSRQRAGTSSPQDLRRFHEVLSDLPVSQGRFERGMRLVMRAWCRLVDWRLQAEGHERLPRRGATRQAAGCIVAAAPHRAWLEPFLLLLAWPPDAARLVWLAEGDTATRSWWRRRILPRIGVIPIERGTRGPHAYADLVRMVLDAGAAVVVFPEVGPPSPPDRPRRLSPGFAYLAIGAGATVVPVVIGGTHRIGRGSRFSLGFLEPLDVGPRAEPFAPAARDRARGLTDHYRSLVESDLPARTALADTQGPETLRWGWLGRLFR